MNIQDLWKDQLTQINAYSFIVWTAVIWKIMAAVFQSAGATGRSTFVLLEKYRCLINQIGQFKNLINKVSFFEAEMKLTNEKLNLLSQMLLEMKEIQDRVKETADASKRAELKDRIAQSYRYHSALGRWTKMDEDAFRDLIQDYEAHGGTNSFIHSICEPESYLWKITD